MIEDNLLNKWLKNELTDAEKEAFSKRDDFAINRNIIDKAQYFKASEFSTVDDFETFKVKYKVESSAKRFSWYKPFLRIASVLVIGFAVYFIMFMNSSIVEEHTLSAEKTTITLPDLSSVTINADSEIKYDKDSWHDNRQLNLKGEAYFKVAKGKTFDVITDQGTVTVVGTEFNVKARDNYFEVICYEGIVKVASDTIIRQLLVGDTYRIVNNIFSEGKTNDTSPQWTTNRSRFKAVPLSEVFDELERQYNINVDIKNTNTTRLFTGSFIHNNLQSALLAITQPMNLEFKISSSNQVLINGNTD